MNLSGKAVRYWMNEMKIPVENLLVISDDLNIPFGTLRLRKNGSAGGHNGLTNINELIGTQDYARIRVGIGNEFGRGQQVDYVLGKLNEEEMEQMKEISKRVIDGVKAWATIGPDRAMNVVNTRPKTASDDKK
jgi:PTH1 family peptidyl-tRNA hydrolase